MIDINVSYGSWPFQRLKHDSLTSLLAHQGLLGITHSMVSHLGAVWHPDPDPYNQELIQATLGVSSLNAVAVINPVWPGWREHCNRYTRSGISAFKLYPSYHGYSLMSKEVRPFMDYMRKHNRALFIQMRIEDERMQHPAAQVHGVGVEEVISIHDAYPEIPCICLNAYLPEVREIAPRAPGIGFDTSFCEWLFTMEHLLDVLPPEQIYLGTHTPFLYTYANIAKVVQSRIPDEAKHQIALLNGKRLLGESSIN